MLHLWLTEQPGYGANAPSATPALHFSVVTSKAASLPMYLPPPWSPPRRPSISRHGGITNLVLTVARWKMWVGWPVWHLRSGRITTIYKERIKILYVSSRLVSFLNRRVYKSCCFMPMAKLNFCHSGLEELQCQRVCNLDPGTDGKPLQMCPATASPTQFTNCWPTLLLLVRLNITSHLILRREESQQGRPRQEQEGRGEVQFCLRCWS